MTVLIDWNMVRWLFSVILNCLGLVEWREGWNLLDWSEQTSILPDTLVHFQFSCVSARVDWMDGFSSRLRSSEKSYWVEESLLAQVDLLKTEPKRDGDRRTLFHFSLCPFLKCQFVYLKDTLSKQARSHNKGKETPGGAAFGIKWKKWIFDRFMTIEPSSYFELLPSK